MRYNFIKLSFLMLTISSFLGCSYITNSLEYPVYGKNRAKVVGRRFITIKELKIVPSEDELWIYYIRPMESSGKNLATVPAGSTLRIVGMSKSNISGFELYSCTAHFETAGIFSKNFGLAYVVKDSDPDSFKVNENYLKEL